jgi:hypothetical protein
MSALLAAKMIEPILSGGRPIEAAGSVTNRVLLLYKDRLQAMSQHRICFGFVASKASKNGLGVFVVMTLR